MFGLTPEDLENELGEVLMARTQEMPAIRGLGPPDLIELQKISKSKVFSTVHYVTGVDVSSAAAIAAYLTTLTRPLGEDQLWFAKAIGWHVFEGTYCAYNAFSKVDIRVTASFPGGTRMHAVTAEQLSLEIDASSEMWTELYMSAMIRSLLLKDDDYYYMENTRHEFPFDTEGVQQFLAAFTELYSRGYLLGASPEVQTASISCNFMVDALLVLLKATGAYPAAVAMLRQLEATEVLAEVLMQSNQEVNAISLLVQAAYQDKRNARVFCQEARFCLAKNQPDLALDCAWRAVYASPSDFYSWEVLCEVYIKLERWNDALLALNSTPLIPMIPADVPRAPVGKKLHRPLPQDGVHEEAWQFTLNSKDPATAHLHSVSPQLARLPAATMRGTSARAYALLAKISNKIGWNELMQRRAQVFWMETETPVKEEAGNAATNKLKSHQDSETATMKAVATKEPSDNAGEEPKEETNLESFVRRSLRSKRLCERRIDRLFLILYEDVRAYSTWQREAVHFESQQLPFEKSSVEWQIFGDIARRLGYIEVAKRAYARSLSMYFNYKALLGLLEFDMFNLDAIVKLLAWYHRWYNEFSPFLMTCLRKIVERDGLTRVRCEVEARFGKELVVDLVNIVLNRLKQLKVVGYDM